MSGRPRFGQLDRLSSSALDEARPSTIRAGPRRPPTFLGTAERSTASSSGTTAVSIFTRQNDKSFFPEAFQKGINLQIGKKEPPGSSSLGFER